MKQPCPPPEINLTPGSDPYEGWDLIIAAGAEQ